MLNSFFRNSGAPTNFYVALCTAAVTPTADTNVMSDLIEIAEGNGYTSGGIQLNRNSTDFDVLQEDDTNNVGRVMIKDLVWTATGGEIPISGNGARWAVLTTDEVAVADRQIIGWIDLAAERTIQENNSLTLTDIVIEATEV